MLKPQFLLPLHRELVIDLFAGGGGASTGIERAIGRPVDIAVNHDREAVAMHMANHPQTQHFVEDVFAVDPVAVVDGRPVGLLWASPDCKHFSKAKGGQPVSKKIRGLAWVVVKWAKLVRPRVILLENVEEFQTWGPLDENNMPCPRRKGRTFKRWKSSLEQLGYKVDFRENRACDFGTPTIRKRLFLIARCDGEPIVFPEFTHFPPDSPQVKQKKGKPYLTAAGCIDWTDPAPSIFERTRELADATKRRIAKGIMRYVVDSANPFIVPLTHQGGDRVEGINEPFKTITGANRGEKALIVPSLVPRYGERDGQQPRTRDIQEPMATVVPTGNGGSLMTAVLSHYQADKAPTDVRSSDVREPLKTQTTENRHALVTAFLTEHANASTQRVFNADEPLRTQVAQVKGGHFAMVSASLVKNYTGVVGSDVRDPMGTVTSVDHHSLLTATLMTNTTGHDSTPPGEPVPTLTTGNQQALVTAALVGVGGRAGQSRPRGPDEPIATVTAKYDTAIVTSHLAKLRGTNVGQPVDEPLHTISAQGTHHAEVRAFLVKYYGNEKEGIPVTEPMHTIPTHDRFGLVMVKGQPYEIVDIGLRMLKRRELFRAQGFDDSYIIEWGTDPYTLQKITITNTASIRMCGNSVCPQMAEAYAKANYREQVAVMEAA